MGLWRTWCIRPHKMVGELPLACPQPTGGVGGRVQLVSPQCAAHDPPPRQDGFRVKGALGGLINRLGQMGTPPLYQ